MNWEEKKSQIERKFDVPITVEWAGWEFGYKALVDVEMDDWVLFQYAFGYRRITALRDLETMLEWIFGPEGRNQDGCPSEENDV